MGGTVYIDRRDAELRVDGGALAMYVNGERNGTVPLAPVDRVVLVGNHKVETAVLHRLSEQGIAVLFLSGRTQAYRGRLVGRLHNHARLRVRHPEPRHATVQGVAPRALRDVAERFNRFGVPSEL